MNWSSAIQQGLEHAELMIVVITPEAMASRNVENEWQYCEVCLGKFASDQYFVLPFLKYTPHRTRPKIESAKPDASEGG